MNNVDEPNVEDLNVQVGKDPVFPKNNTTDNYTTLTIIGFNKNISDMDMFKQLVDSGLPESFEVGKNNRNKRK